MQPKVKMTLSVLTFAAMVLTGLAAAEQVHTARPIREELLRSPNIISLSPKVVGNSTGAAPDTTNTTNNLDSSSTNN
jgi:hypothetical protein